MIRLPGAAAFSEFVVRASAPELPSVDTFSIFRSESQFKDNTLAAGGQSGRGRFERGRDATQRRCVRLFG
jgi:hypothetical protein